MLRAQASRKSGAERSLRAALAPALSTDTRYAGINPPDVTVTNIDNEVVQVLVTPLGSIETSEVCSSAGIEVRLSAKPSAEVVIALSNPDASEPA